MSAEHLLTGTEPRLDRSGTDRATHTTPADRPPTARVPYTFRHRDRKRLRNLFDECNAVIVDPTLVEAE